METKLIIFVLITLFYTKEIAAGKKLIVVLIDGFRWDYINDPSLNLKGIPKIIERGVRAPYVNPVFPSLSYPNTYTIVTGLYPENHGFVDNIMYDRETGKIFNMRPKDGSNDEHWWNVAEPIWVTAEKQGKFAAMYWWAGCDVKIKGVQPMICERHRWAPLTEQTKKDYLERIDDIVQLFKPPSEDRLSLAMIYSGAVDYAGHSSGVGSSELRRAVQDVDEILHEMVKKIDAAGLQNEVNIMVVSDHGMTNVQRSNATDIDLEQFASNIKYQASYGATMMLVPEDGMLDKLYTDLKQANVKGLQVYKKEKIPESFHLKESPRVSDIFLQARKGYFIKSLKDPNKVLGGVPGNDPGYHGFDPDEVPDMRSIFFATGPGFRRGVTSKPLNNTDLYNMMCRVLNIQPLPNNGSMELVKDILSQEDSSPLEYNSASSYVQGSICIISLHFVFVSVLLNKFYSQL